MQLFNELKEKALFSCLSKFAVITVVLLVLVVRPDEKLWSDKKTLVQD